MIQNLLPYVILSEAPKGGGVEGSVPFTPFYYDL